MRDFGVNFSSNLNFDVHISETIIKTLSVLGFTFRNASSFKRILVIKSLYFTLARSILEFVIVIFEFHIKIINFLTAHSEKISPLCNKVCWHIWYDHFSHDHTYLRSTLLIPKFSLRIIYLDSLFLFIVTNGLI